MTQFLFNDNDIFQPVCVTLSSVDNADHQVARGSQVWHHLSHPARTVAGEVAQTELSAERQDQECCSIKQVNIPPVAFSIISPGNIPVS